MTMRERMARALDASVLENNKLTSGDTLECFVDRTWPMYLNNADAVLDALLEPTEGMVEAGHNPDNASLSNTREWIGASFQAMIRATREGK